MTLCYLCHKLLNGPSINLGIVPLANDYLRGPDVPRASLNCVCCRSCGAWQLDEHLSSKLYFPNDYPHRSRTTVEQVSTFTELADIATNFVGRAGIVLDIGCNDGTALDGFKRLGWKTFGVDLIEKAVSEAIFHGGHEAFCAAFDSYFVTDNELLDTFDLATASNVFSHVPDPNEFLKAASLALKQDGLLIIENRDAYEVASNNQWDVIYHGHLRIYSVNDVYALAHKHGWDVVSTEKLNVHGGSHRIVLKNKKRVTTFNKGTLSNILNHNPESISIFTEFATKAKSSSIEIWKLMESVFETHGPIPAFGATFRSSSLIEYTGIEAMISHVFETADSPKIGGRLPGTNIPVLPEPETFGDEANKPALILPWYLGTRMISSLRNRGYTGDFIIPLPTPTINSLRGV